MTEKNNMTNHNTAEKHLFELLRDELWNTGISFTELSHEDYAALIQIASEQTVTGLVANSLIRNGVKLSRTDAVELYARIKSIEQGNDNVNKNLVSFVQFMERKDVDYIIVKGQVTGALYPTPNARMSGDIDLYFVGENYNRIKNLVEQRLGRKLGKLSDGKHVEFRINGVVYELHDKLSRLATRKHQEYWDRKIDQAIREKTDNVVIDGKDVKTLSGTYNAIYVFVHLFYHMTASGVGLRQLCDWTMVLKAADNNYRKLSAIDKERLEEVLTRLGYIKAYKAMGAFVVGYLGLPEEMFPLTIGQKDKKWTETIKKNILKRGNFGRTGRKVKDIGVLHSMETGYLNMAQTLTFYRLAPQEVLLRFTSLGEWFLERFKIKKDRKSTTE